MMHSTEGRRRVLMYVCVCVCVRVCVSTQVQAGAHLDVPDFEGLLPLHQAACTGNVEFARLLVEAGAPINLHTVKYITQESLEAQVCAWQRTGDMQGQLYEYVHSSANVTNLYTMLRCAS